MTSLLHIYTQESFNELKRVSRKANVSVSKWSPVLVPNGRGIVARHGLSER